jgi:hypothetical protein
MESVHAHTDTHYGRVSTSGIHASPNEHACIQGVIAREHVGIDACNLVLMCKHS